MSAHSIVRPVTEASTYRQLAFLASGLLLGTAWLVLLVAGWSLTLGLAITFLLALPVVLGLAYASRWAADVERHVANTLLDAGVALPARRLPLRGGLWPRVRAWLGDPLGWREQAYLVLRFLVGLPFGVLTLSLIGTSLGLVAAPTWYWTNDEVLGSGDWRVDTLGEALAAVPVGLLGLLFSAHLVRWLGAASRGMSRGLLGAGGSAPAPSQPRAADGKARSMTRGHRAGLIWHGAASALLVLVMILIWAATTRGYLWPVWVFLPLGLAFAVHGAAERGARQPAGRRALAIHAGVTGWLSVFLVGIWAASTHGYFWPAWAIGALMLIVGVHAVWAYMRRGERIEQLTSTRAGAVDAQAAELRRIERDLHDGAQARLVALSMDLAWRRRGSIVTPTPPAASWARRGMRPAGPWWSCATSPAGSTRRS